jgi:hypothetical protein
VGGVAPRRAGTDALYAAAFRAEPNAECRNCHTPLNASPAPLNAVSEGVGCAVCHVRNGTVLVASQQAAERTAPHGMKFEPTLRTEDACASCHQFNFFKRVADSSVPTQMPMQTTVSEHEASRAAKRTCQSCHMREGHRLLGPHDPEFMRQAIRVEATRTSATRVRVRVSSKAGHAVPTGDIFRALELTVADEADAQRHTSLVVRSAGSGTGSFSSTVLVPLEEKQRVPYFLGLSFIDVPSSSVHGEKDKLLIGDTRVPPSGEATWEVEVPAQARRLRFRLDYHFAMPDVADTLRPFEGHAPFTPSRSLKDLSRRRDDPFP